MIKFTEEHSRNEIIFLDSYVKRDNDSLYTDLYSHTQLSAFHIMPTQNLYKKRPIWQFSADQKQLHKKCWLWQTFKGHENALWEPRLPWWNHRGTNQKARNQDHHKLIHGTKTKAEGTQRIPLVLTYNPLIPYLIKIIKKHWPVLHLSPECKKLFPATPILAYRRNRNLWDTLVRASLLKSVNGKRPKTSPKQMSKTKLYMVPWIENFKPNHMHCYRPYFLWSRKHQLRRQQRGIYTDLQPMQETVYWQNGKTVYRKMERTSLWHQGEMTIPSHTSFQRSWQSPGSHAPCQHFDLNQRPRKRRDRQTQISRKPVDFHLQVLPTRRHKRTRIDQTGHTSCNPPHRKSLNFTTWNFQTICTLNEKSLVLLVILLILTYIICL